MTFILASMLSDFALVPLLSRECFCHNIPPCSFRWPSALDICQYLASTLDATQVVKVASLQTLWSGYGEIARYQVQLNAKRHSVIVKHICPPLDVDHPYQWHNANSHQRKMRSYQVEAHWYQHWSHLCGQATPMPTYIGHYHDDKTNESIMILSDLDAAGYPLRYQSLTVTQTKAVLSWLAAFHGQFIIQDPAQEWPEGLWPQGTYWYLATRMQEYTAMDDGALKQAAQAIDARLNLAQFQTLVHGDAKVANFCFQPDAAEHGASVSVAALDFQYVGKGCGVKDVIYLLGSCLDEAILFTHYDELMEHYFSQFRKSASATLTGAVIDAAICEWQQLLPFAWADFERFLAGWAPSHHKRHRFSDMMTRQALAQL